MLKMAQQMTWDMVCAAINRGTAFQVQMPIIRATFDNGVHCGTVRVVDTERGRVVVKRDDGTTDRFRVSVDCLMVSEETAEHLTRAGAWVEAVKTGRAFRTGNASMDRRLNWGAGAR